MIELTMRLLMNRFIYRFSSKEKKNLLSNFVSLLASQGVNYLLPLITTPYLIRVLGYEKVGLIAFAQALIAYFLMLTDYGFNLSATRDISRNRDDAGKIANIFNTVMTIKVVLMCISVVCLTLIAFGFKKLRLDFEVYLFSFGIVVGQVFYPMWFFQGMERMKYITFLNIVAKLIFTISVFLFVRKASDYLYVPLIYSLGFMASGALGLWAVRKDYGISFRMPTFIDVKLQLRSGWHIFLSRVFVNLYSSTNIIILGALTNDTLVGYYSVAEKISSPLAGLGAPFNQAVYPYLAKLYTISRRDYFRIALKLLLILLLSVGLGALLLFIFASELTGLIGGGQNKDVATTLRILTFTVIFLPLGGYLTQLLVIQNKNKVLSGIVFAASVLNFAIIVPSVLLYGVLGLAGTVLIVQVFVNLIIITYLALEKRQYA